MQVVLHSNSFHLIIVALIILDIIIVLFELLLDVGALGAFYTELISLLSYWAAW